MPSSLVPKSIPNNECCYIYTHMYSHPYAVKHVVNQALQQTFELHLPNMCMYSHVDQKEQ